MKRFFVIVGTTGWSFGLWPPVRKESTGGEDFQVFINIAPGNTFGR